MDILKKTYDLIPKEFRVKIVLIFLSSILVALLEILSIALILPLITALINPEGLNFLNKYFDIQNLISLLNKSEVITYGILVFVLIILIKVIALIFLNIYKANFYYKIRIKMTNILFKKYLNEDYLFHVYNNSSVLITNIHGEIGLFVKKILNVFSEIFLDFILFFSLLIILLNIRFYETLITLFIFIIFILFYYYLIKKRLDYWGKERQKKDRLKLNEGVDSKRAELSLARAINRLSISKK